jgi:hypothetical protein
MRTRQQYLDERTGAVAAERLHAIGDARAVVHLLLSDLPQRVAASLVDEPQAGVAGVVEQEAGRVLRELALYADRERAAAVGLTAARAARR